MATYTKTTEIIEGAPTTKQLVRFQRIVSGLFHLSQKERDGGDPNFIDSASRSLPNVSDALAHIARASANEIWDIGQQCYVRVSTERAIEQVDRNIQRVAEYLERAQKRYDEKKRPHRCYVCDGWNS